MHRNVYQFGPTAPLTPPPVNTSVALEIFLTVYSAPTIILGDGPEWSDNGVEVMGCEGVGAVRNKGLGSRQEAGATG